MTRGFTGHEHLDQVGLIHMGGRVYDPELGWFLSPDPFVQFPASTQGFNRYAYVGNNPLSYTDPSGYFLKKLMKVAGIGMNFIPGWTLMNNAFIHGFVSGFLASEGDVKAGMMGMMSAGIAGEIGKINDLSNFSRSALHGITQGAISAAGGGRFGDGALGAFAGSYFSFIPEAVAGPYGSGGEWAKIGRMTAAAVVGGTASALGGGKFANGAWSAAFVSRFNHDSSGARRRAAREARAAIGSEEAVGLAPGAYPIIVDAVSASLGPITVESGDIWLVDKRNDRVLLFRYHSIGAGVGLGASTSRHYGVLGLESAADVTGITVAVGVDGVPGVGGSGSFFSGVPAYSPGAAGGFAVGLHAGFSFSAGHVRFLRSFPTNSAPVIGWKP
ncbi:RHS repeat-associated core domain-containing protein [Thioalkalivibrio sp. XN8]|uniref:RHS repeat-associated core domain-containing protein n=1 Tax=Thioalkalivibrio sp. XN8 TaxID=2712863 RepID=UPI0023F360AA|nr:RHS repeat-associated core domain-containing protein [Thioalkalivibrio sp. XN8]